MRTATTKKLAIAALLLVVGAVILKTGTSTSGHSDAALMLPGLKSQLNQFQRLTVRHGDDTVTIERADDNWVVVEKNNYPADAVKLRNALLELAEARRLEAKTANPERHEQLGLSGDGDGTMLELKGTTDDTFTPVSLIAGKSVQGDYRYARMSDDNQAWLIDRDPDIPATASEWLDDKLLDIRSIDIQSARIEHADGERLSFTREDGALTPDNLPEGRELTSPSAANSIGNALQGLQLDDVRPAPAGIQPDASTILTSASGLSVTARHYRLDDEDWFAFSASVAEPAADAALPNGTDIDSDSDSDSDSDGTGDSRIENQNDEASATDKAQEAKQEQEAALALSTEINDRVQGWLYKLPAYKGDALIKRWADLLKSAGDA